MLALSCLEEERLSAIHNLGILDSLPEPHFDAIVDLARGMFGVPISVISVLDRDRQWFKARSGLDTQETERQAAFCNFTVLGDTAFVVEDAHRDPRFSASKLVTEAPNIRFYAGYPLALEDGVAVGSLCLLDTSPRDFSGPDRAKLQQLGAVAVGLVRQFRDARRANRMLAEQELQKQVLDTHITAIAKQNRMFSTASKLAALGAWEYDRLNDVITWSEGTYEICKLDRDERLNFAKIYDMYTPECQKQLLRTMDKATRDGTGYTFEGEIITPEGKRRWLRLFAESEIVDGVVVRRCGVVQDITDQHLLFKRLKFLATHDTLTRLLNRAAIRDRLQAIANVPSGPGLTRAFLLVDVDGFKFVNDAFGHRAGDACLKELARRLKRLCRPAEIARLGSDEFAVFYGELDAGQAVDEIGQRILEAFREPIEWKGQSFRLSASIGATSWSDCKSDGAEVIMETDLALHDAKTSGRNTIRLFSSALKASADRRAKVIHSMADALENNELELFYQPKFRLADRSLAGFEALLRRRRPDGSVATPGEFAAAFEDPELARKIDEIVLFQSISQAKTWQAAGLDFGHIAVNLSPHQFRNPALGDQLAHTIASANLPASSIEIEVTEGVFLEEQSYSILQQLKRSGIKIALDDFGTGYASLTHIRRYPVDTIKIDQSFVQPFLTHIEDKAIIRSILFLARSLRINVVAEGIETQEQAEALKTLGCQVGQGYHFARPLSVGDTTNFLAAAARGGAPTDQPRCAQA
ncbi:diguanylate cyclase/phosphodiesterase with PAS/PAC sensor(s) /diguanylate cyclase/phosphodiesterase with PAS/PAC and GAF sensor(s) [Rhizobiales bacterium GAS191]|nr:diguanylate cyclase/phosphodiesterase with PAS/PAC sensor(s) /diguanylate cyclase/phosphodiesterase with PAS/PAC and GAF sensor(s) [Rhizobiales bacterium GAS191]